MSLSSMYAQLRSYESSASWWRTSASQYQDQMNATNAQLTHKRDQLAKANAAKGKVDALPDANQAVSDDLLLLGNTINACMAEPAAPGAAQKVNQDNADAISRAQNACTTLITNLQNEIATLEGNLATQTEGRDYSNGRAATYDRYASNMRTRIANYDGD